MTHNDRLALFTLLTLCGAGAVLFFGAFFLVYST